MTTGRIFVKLALVMVILSGVTASGQEHGASLRRENYHNIHAMVDSVYPSQLRAGGVNYRASKTVTFEFSTLIPAYETARWQWAVGAGWKRREVKFADQPALPGVLHEVNIPVAASVELAEFTTLGLSIKPGIYSDMYDIGFSDLNAPVGLRLFTEHSPELLTIVGFQLDWYNNIPIIPDIGVRWYFWYDWVLDFRLPNPRIEYEINDHWKIHAGMEWLGGAYRVSDGLGTPLGRPGLDDSTLTYRDLRIKAGVEWSWDEDSFFAVSGGWSVKRRFIYDGNHQLSTRGAPFVQWMFRTSW